MSGACSWCEVEPCHAWPCAGIGKVVIAASLIGGRAFSQYTGLELSGLRNDEVRLPSLILAAKCLNSLELEVGQEVGQVDLVCRACA